MKENQKGKAKSNSQTKTTELKTEGPISEKDEIKQAEDRMRKKLKS